MATAYGVLRKSGEWFAGFDKDGNPVWTVDKGGAMVIGDKLAAECQARLFVCAGVNVQKSPASLNKGA